MHPTFKLSRLMDCRVKRQRPDDDEEMDGVDIDSAELHDTVLFNVTHKKLTRQQLAALGERVAFLESQLAAKDAAAKMDTPAILRRLIAVL